MLPHYNRMEYKLIQPDQGVWLTLLLFYSSWALSIIVLYWTKFKGPPS